jgi:hypothetical protein
VDEELEKLIQSARIQVNHRRRIARQKAAARSSYILTQRLVRGGEIARDVKNVL